MPAPLKPSRCSELALLVSSTLFKRLTRWLLKPISPRKYQPPKSSTGGACIGGAAIEGISAANAIEHSSDAAAAATTHLTLRMGFRPFGHEAELTSKTHGRTMAPNV